MRSPAGPIGAAAALVLAMQAGTARAQAPPVRFDIPEGPLPAALLEFAVQARISISIGAAAKCRPTSNRLVGRFAPSEGLRRLLAGTGCAFREGADGAIIVVRSSASRAGERRAGAAAGQSSPHAAPAPGVEEVVVTVGRRAALLDRAPYAVSVVGAPELKAEGARDLNDVAPMVASLGMTDLGPGRDKIFVRGLADSALTGQVQSTVGIYLDGARITYNAPDPDLRLVDVRRVEVLRGPQGALYGAGSIGGILHIVTNRPQLQTYAAELDSSVSATVGGAPGWSVDGMLNLPLAPGKLALRVVAYDEVQGGYVDDVRLGLSNLNEVRRRGLRAQARWQASLDWSLTLGVVRQRLDSSDTHYAEPALGGRLRANFLREPHDNDFLQASAELAGRFGWGEITATSSVLRHDFDSRYDASLALPLFAPGAGIRPSPYDDTNRAELLVNEVTAASPETGRLRWLLGAFQNVGDNNSSADLRAPLGPDGSTVAVYTERRYDLVRELALYGQVSYALTPKLTLTAGGRGFRSSVKTRSHVSLPLEGASNAFTGKTSASGFAPQVVLRYAPNDGMAFYLQASEGYRSGGFNTAGLPGQLFAGPGAPDEPHRRYAGDELWNYEAGAKLTLLDGMARVRAAAFYMVWKNVQSDQLLPNGLPYTTNIGDGRDLGVEAEADVEPDAHWRIRLNGTFADPELTRPAPAFVARPDNGLPGAPRFSASASAAYQRPALGKIDLRLQAAIAYVGPSHVTLDGATSAPMGNYATGRFSAALVSPGWSLTAFLNTPFEGGNTFAFGNPFTFRVIAQSTPPRPTTAGLRLSLSAP